MDTEFQTIRGQWDSLLALCDDDTLFHLETDAVSDWSVGRHLGHLGIVLNFLADAIDNMLANPDQNVGLEPVDLGKAVLEAGEIPRGRGQAPDFLKLLSEAKPDEIKTMLLGAKDKWDAFSEKYQQIQDCPATFAHFALGNFTPAQWVRFNTVHTDHHLKIIRDIVEPSEHVCPF